MGVFLFGLICGFAAAVAFATYEDGEPFLRFSRAARLRLSQAIEQLPGLARQGAEQTNRIAQQARQAYSARVALRPARPIWPAATAVTAGIAAAVRVCPDCGNQITRQGADFCGKCGATLPAPAIPHRGTATAFGALDEAFNLWLTHPGLLLVPAQGVLVVVGWQLLMAVVWGGSLMSGRMSPYTGGGPPALNIWPLITVLVVIPYAYAGVAGGIIRALDGAPDFMRFLEDGLRYIPRSWLVMILYFLYGIMFALIMVLSALVLGAFGASALQSGQQAPATFFLFLSIMFLVPTIFWITFAPYWVMATAGAFQDGAHGVSLGFGVARACRWRLLGVILMLILIGLIAYVVLLLFGVGAVAFDWQSLAHNPANPLPLLAAFAAQSSLLLIAYGVMMAALIAFGLTVFLVFYRGAVYSQPAPAIANAAPQLPASEP